jgi:hypothetical protein
MVNENPTVDQVSVDDGDSGPKIEDNIKSRHTWLRLLFMVVFGILLWLAGLVGMVVVIFGFLWVLFKGEVNEELRGIGQSLARYVFEIVRYLTFNADEKPFPFGGRWPSADD